MTALMGLKRRQVNRYLEKNGMTYEKVIIKNEV
jgi:hypothetical protein